MVTSFLLDISEIWKNWGGDWNAASQTEEHRRRYSFWWEEDKDCKISREEDSNNSWTRKIKVEINSRADSSYLFFLPYISGLHSLFHSLPQMMQDIRELGLGLLAASWLWFGWTVLQVSIVLHSNIYWQKIIQFY